MKHWFTPARQDNWERTSAVVELVPVLTDVIASDDAGEDDWYLLPVLHEILIGNKILEVLASVRLFSL